MSFVVTIDDEKCDGCGECVDICPADVLEMADEKSKVADLDECLGCESCVEVCPNEAIEVTEE